MSLVGPENLSQTYVNHFILVRNDDNRVVDIDIDPMRLERRAKHWKECYPHVVFRVIWYEPQDRVIRNSLAKR